MIAFAFYLMLGFFIAHEVDAVSKHEWRLFPVLRGLNDDLARKLFIWSHLPMLAAIFWLTAGQSNGTIAKSLSGFAIVHIGLHWYFRNRPAYEFNTLGSWTLIVMAGAFGAIHLIAGFV